MAGTEAVGGTLIVTPNSAPVVLQKILQSQLGSGVIVENNGAPGATAVGRIQGLSPWYTKPFATALQSEKAQIVIGNWAINDCQPIHQESVQQYQAALTEFVNEVRAAGKIAVLEEPNPTTTGIPLADYVAAMDSVSAQLNVPLIAQYQHILSLPNWQSMLSEDGGHPADAMYAIKAQQESLVLALIVKSLQ